MAFGNSGLYLQTFNKVFDATQLAFAYLADAMNVALYTNTLAAQNFDSDTAYNAAPYTSNEIASGGGYTTGGNALASKTESTSPSGTMMFDAADLQWTSATFSLVRGCLIYDNTLAGKNAVCLVNFAADYGVTAGTLTIQWNALGIFTIDITP